MKKTLIFLFFLVILLFLFFILSESLFAFDWESKRITLKSQEKIKGKTHIILEDNTGKTFSITHYKKELTDDLNKSIYLIFNETARWKNIVSIEFTVKGDEIFTIISLAQPNKLLTITLFGTQTSAKIIDKVAAMLSKFNAWKHISYTKIDFGIRNNTIDSLVFLENYTYKKTDLKLHLPAGLMFSYDKNMIYNFRVVNKRNIVRVTNKYRTEDKLSNDILSAVKNPRLYIERYDQDYFYHQLERLRDKHTELLYRHEKLLEDHNKLIYGLITMESASLLGGKPVEKEIIQEIIKLKTENPQMTNEQIRDHFETMEVDLSKKLVDLILGLCFNEFQ